VGKTIKPFSNWWADIPFDEIEGSKTRPVLVYDGNKVVALCMRMTSKSPKTKDDFVLTRWKDAGLARETVVNTSRKLKLNPSDLIEYIGELHPDDVKIIVYRYLTYG
jgi:hypothetical protein